MLLAPSWPGPDIWSATVARVSHARDAVAVAVAEVDPVSDHQETCEGLCTLPAVSPETVGLDLIPVGRLPADDGSWSRFRTDVRTCSLRGPPLA